MSVTIKEVRTKKELKKFIRFGIKLYKDCHFAAPPLIMDDWLNLSKNKNPALKFCQTVYFLAYRDGKIVGRIAGIINPVANETWKQRNVRFGWVDFIDDKEVSFALFDAVIAWAKLNGMEHIHGPLGFTDFDKEGALIDGYDQMGTLATIYNHPYYIQHYLQMGFVKEVDWNEYLITIPEVFPEKFFRIAEVVKQKYKLKPLRFSSKKALVNNYGEKVFKLLNDSYKDLFNFTKLNQEQIEFYIKLYFSFIRLDTIVLVSNEKDDLVALGIAMPSFTKALQKVKGKLFPIGWYYMLQALYKNDVLDLYLMSVHPDYQNKGVNAIVFAEMMPNAAKNGYKIAETNPELETNRKMYSQWEAFEYINHKKRRVFTKQL